MIDQADQLLPVNFVVYSSGTGIILRSGTCARRDVGLQASAAGEIALETTEYRSDAGWKVSPTGDVIPIDD